MEECKVQDCNKPIKCKEYCSKHYAVWWRTGDPIPKSKPRKHKICSVEGCNENHRRKGFCATHSHRYYRHGNPNAVHPNKMTEDEKFAARKISQRKYNKSDKGKVASKRKIHRRRHLEASDVQLTVEDYKFIYTKFDNKCFNCGLDHDLTFDHHIPLSKGGKLERDNTVLLCHLCNSTKADQDPETFYSEDKLKLLKSL